MISTRLTLTKNNKMKKIKNRPVGWRLVRVGEVIREGDLVFHADITDWNQTRVSREAGRTLQTKRGYPNASGFGYFTRKEQNG
jgi:hypothetical protein